MILVKNIQTLSAYLSRIRLAGRSIGFVPTMGALHKGHVSLVERSLSENSFTVCSIFVNPAQFTNVIDFQKYPVTIESDIDKLEKANCSLLFLPSEVEMYPLADKPVRYELGSLENILEGEYRPGHFQGVCRIVDKLLAVVQPDVMYLGRKDYQQCLIIKKMMDDRHYKTTLQICDTVREQDGLAMSSRNLRLNPEERKQAVKIIDSLNLLKRNIHPGDLLEIKRKARSFLEQNGYKVDYTEIADAETLEIQDEWDGKRKILALTAAYLNDVRLIDNIVL